MKHFTVMRPQPVTVQGLFEVLERGLQGLGIQEVSAEHWKKLVGIYLSLCQQAADECF